MIQMCLEIGGYQVATARDGEDGYLAYLLFKPDLVITDIQMPKKDGLELVRNIRAHNPNVRTIYMGHGEGSMGDFWVSMWLEGRPVLVLDHLKGAGIRA